MAKKPPAKPAAPVPATVPATRPPEAVPEDAALARLLAYTLVAGTVLLFSSTVHFDFVYFDDPQCVTLEPHVTAGLTWEGIRWAFTGQVLGHWKPLVSLTHMVDCEFFGLEPEAHHAVNVLWHAATVVMLFLALRRLTGATWRSALVAAMFAWHPLRVESVAWVTERKDVVSGFFWMLTLWLYAGYARQPSTGRYLGTLGAFALGLMAKSIVVTLPCVLLLLDVWPLRRARMSVARTGNPDDGVAPVPWSRLVLEKLPFFALAGAVAALTYQISAHTGNLTGGDAFPLVYRLGSALVGYLFYLEKLVWPVNLGALYPIILVPSTARLALGVVGIAGVSLLALRLLPRAPCVAVGWFWFLGVLAPVIGIVQAGIQSTADRYSYLPHVGLFITLVWSVHEWCGVNPLRQRLAGVCAGGVLIGWAALTASQLHHWQDSSAVFRRVISVTEDNAQAYNILGHTLHKFGQVDEATRLFEAGVRAIPGNALIQYNLGVAYESKRRFEDAAARYRIAARLDPGYGAPRNNLGLLQLNQGDLAGAETNLIAARMLDPGNPETPYNLARLRLRQGRTNDAATHLQGALTLLPDFPQALRLLATIHRANGRLAEARQCAERALELSPRSAEARSELAEIRLAGGQAREALELWQEAARADPSHVPALKRAAWVLATHPNAQVRRPVLALSFAEAAVRLAADDPESWDALGAALAVNARFAEAETAAARAVALATAAGNTALSAEATARRESYRRQQPHVDASLSK